MVKRHELPKYEAETTGIIVRARPKFRYDEPEPAKGVFFWSYTIEVENASDRVWTLTRRYWTIVDAKGRNQIVEGEGVVGQTPTLQPGERFSYTSGCPLSAPSGMMSGFYDFVDETGAALKAIIPPFSLDSPYDTSLPS